jgi:hypothetical protein
MPMFREGFVVGRMCAGMVQGNTLVSGWVVRVLHHIGPLVRFNFSFLMQIQHASCDTGTGVVVWCPTVSQPLVADSVACGNHQVGTEPHVPPVRTCGA